MKLRNRIFITVFGIVLCATGFQSFGAEGTPLSTAAGYYHTDYYYLLIMDNGIICGLDPSYGDINVVKGFDVQKKESAYLVTWSEHDKMLFVEQTESESSPDGGGYYAVYDDYIGSVEYNSYDAEKHVLFDDYIFSNEYMVFRKEPLSVFFGSDNSQYLEDETEELATAVPEEAQTADESFRHESAGFSTPEEALGAYIKGLQNQDFSEMLSAFAVETFAEKFNLASYLDYYTSYSISSLNYIPYISDLSRNINIRIRLRGISSHIRYQYLTLTNPDSTSKKNTDEPINVRSDEYKGVADFVTVFFAAEDSSVLTSIEFADEFIDPAILEEKYARDFVQERFHERQAIYGADDIQSVVALIKVKDEDYILCADAAKYGEKWYLVGFDSCIGGALEGSVFRGGLFPIEDGEVLPF